MFGALTVVTGPTVIIPMLKTVRPTASISTIIRWEGIVIDPIGASLGVLVYEFIIAGGGQGAWIYTLVTFGVILAAGGITGLAGEYIFGLLFSEHADRHLDLVGIGCLLALSHHESINTSAAMVS